MSGVMSWTVVVFLALVGPSVARLSPNADSVDQLIADGFDPRILNDVIEDARLDVPDLVGKYNYPIEKHQVVTSDGYILEVHRIPYGRDGYQGPNRPVVLVMHGLFSSSADWVLMGPDAGFAYILADSGFDVWLGNARGNYYSRKHISLHPNLYKFWEFGWEEIGTKDLPAMIDFALTRTGQTKLHYIGHAQGSTAFFVMGSMLPEYNEKILSMHALAPIAYMGSSPDKFLQRYASNTNTEEFVSSANALTQAGQATCRNTSPFPSICDNILFLLAGWNEALINSTMLPVKMGHTPAGASIRQLAHFGQSVKAGTFSRFDYGSRRNNQDVYGTNSPPDYDLSKVTTPVFLHYGNGDTLVHDQDVDRLLRELGRSVGKFLVPDRGFSHLDFLWGVDARNLVYTRIMNLMRAVSYIASYSDLAL